MQSGAQAVSPPPSIARPAARAHSGRERERDARLQRTGPLGGDGGERHGGDLAPARDPDRARHPARRRQRGRCGDRGGGDAMRRRAGKHRDRRRLLCPLFEKRRPADRAERRRTGAGQGACRMVRRAPDPRDRRADAARRHGARRDRRLVPVEPRARHEAAVGDPRTGGQGGRARLCRDAARRG